LDDVVFFHLTDFPSGIHDDIIQKEAEILHNYVSNNLVINQDGTVDLPQERAPVDFDLSFTRVCNRRAYSFETENKETFTVKLSYEDFKDLRKTSFGDVRDMVWIVYLEICLSLTM
jgi:hypothetical protein